MITAKYIKAATLYCLYVF